MSWTWKEIFGVDKFIKFARTMKEVGGIRGFVKQRYLMDQTRVGKLVGEDKFGNKYYEDNSYYVPRNRWVVYTEKVWLDYDGSQVPPEWHRWLHHISDQTPVENPPEQHKWMLDHVENKTLSPSEKYVPYSTTRTKIHAWQPKQA
ncbi:NADH-ubiquinone oxidoreductase subunit B17.2 [Aphelenchoides avenae]|nr:NADH-ubiquinone oxidoreductase subunit B17.2 [Aphelenchus avenae]